MEKLLIDGESLTIEDVVAVARKNVQVALSKKAVRNVQKSRKTLEEFVKKKKIIYGVTTGFGALGNVTISADDVEDLQVNLIRSHSACVGKTMEQEAVRALMLLRANTLAKGYSGIRLETLETLIQMLNKGVHPVIPEKGSVGASGDLGPLSHMTLVMMGEGEAEFKGKVMRGGEALKEAKIRPVKLDFKEGVALNNGTQMMTALAALAVFDAEILLKTAETSAALSIEALNGILDAFDERIHNVRPHKGQRVAARNIRLLTAESRLVLSGEEAIKRGLHPQDPYSLRCVPQVMGAVRDAVAYARRVVEVEINSATDNPLIFANDNSCLSGGNFHGQPVAMAMDFLATALTVLGNVSERRTARLIDENLNRGLPQFLVHKDVKKGLHSGLMYAQYTAAALASENKTLAHPASTDSIPTSANFEDFVSMGPIAARKARAVLENVEYIVAIELLCAAQAVDFRGPEKLGKGTRVAYELLRKHVPILKEDRVLSGDIENLKTIVHEGGFVEAVKTVAGDLE
ncbi:MAG: histidine ammonia-lyase [Candidatus Bathyarchaeia archaeon]|nr:histidine ammonia-lyase [Candidatus Bathyarchaeota archaeon]